MTIRMNFLKFRNEMIEKILYYSIIPLFQGKFGEAQMVTMNKYFKKI